MKVKLSKEEKKAQREKRREVWKHRAKNFKSKDQKQKEEKAYRPPGHTARKAGVIVFWTLFAFMLFVVGVNMAQPKSTTTQASSNEEEKVENLAIKPESIQFAKNFTKEYFTWGLGAESAEQREKRLQPYLAKGIDPQAGLNMDSLEYGSTWKNAEVRQVEEIGENKAIITFLVDYELSKTIEKEVTKGKGKDKKKEIVEETETENGQKYLAVPVGFDGGYGIYDFPKFTYLEGGTQLEKEELKGDPVSDKAIETRIKDFLPTFFGSYASDPINKLGYVLADPTVSNGLNGSMEFVEVSKATIHLGDKQEAYVAAVDVVFKDPTSGTQFTTTYDLGLEEREGRFVVTKLNEGK